MGKGIWTCTRCGEIMSKKEIDRLNHKCKKVMVEVEKLQAFDAEMARVVGGFEQMLGYAKHLENVLSKAYCCCKIATDDVEKGGTVANVFKDEHEPDCVWYEIRHPKAMEVVSGEDGKGKEIKGDKC